jgi:hypothetical protein
MSRSLVVVVWMAAVAVHANTWRPCDRLLQAVRFVESSNGLLTWGDEGESLGDFQLSEAAWVDVNRWRKARSLPQYDYEPHVWNRKLNRAYAADYLTILHGELSKRLKRAPTPSELYAAYNMGLQSFAQCQYKLARVNPITAKKCEQIRVLMRQRSVKQ